MSRDYFEIQLTMDQNLNKSLDIVQVHHQDRVGLADQQDRPYHRNQERHLVRLYLAVPGLYHHLFHLVLDNQVCHHYHLHHQVQENLFHPSVQLALMDLVFLVALSVLVVHEDLEKQIQEVLLFHCPHGSRKDEDPSKLS